MKEGDLVLFEYKQFKEVAVFKEQLKGNLKRFAIAIHNGEEVIYPISNLKLYAEKRERDGDVSN